MDHQSEQRNEGGEHRAYRGRSPNAGNAQHAAEHDAMRIMDARWSLSDAEPRKDHTQEIVSRELSGNLAKPFPGKSQLLGKKLEC